MCVCVCVCLCDCVRAEKEEKVCSSVCTGKEKKVEM